VESNVLPETIITIVCLSAWDGSILHSKRVDATNCQWT